MRIYYINLEKSKERRDWMESQLSKIASDQIEYERVSAINGETLTQEDIDAVIETASNNSYELKPNEIACFISHKKVWEKIANSKDQYSVILEDDILLSSKASRFFSDTNWIPNGVPYIRLEKTNDPFIQLLECKKDLIIDDINIRLYKFNGGFGSAAYLIHKQFAKWLLNRFKTFQTQVDVAIADPLLFDSCSPTNLDCKSRLQMSPAIATQLQFQKKKSLLSKEVRGSTIRQRRTNSYSKIKRELIRLVSLRNWKKIIGTKIRFLE